MFKQKIFRKFENQPLNILWVLVKLIWIKIDLKLKLKRVANVDFPVRSTALWPRHSSKIELSMEISDRGILKCPCIEIFENFLLANMKDRWKPKRKLFTICCYLFTFQRYELSKSRKSWENIRKENCGFCAPLTKSVTSQVGLLLIQYLNQMSFRRY